METTTLPMPVYDYWWHPRMMLFSQSDGAGYGIDTETGKVIRWDHDGGSLSVTHENFVELLDEILEGLKNDHPPFYWKG